MKFTNLIALAAVSLSLISCGGAGPVKPMSEDFSANDIAWSTVKGSNTLNGSGFTRTNNGQTVNCAGFIVNLIPFSRYSAERMLRIYNSTEAGNDKPIMIYNTATIAGVVDNRAPAYPAQYLATVRQTQCDAAGRFTFNNLPDGAYFVAVNVEWLTYQGNMVSRQGGSIMNRVVLNGGITDTVISDMRNGGNI